MNVSFVREGGKWRTTICSIVHEYKKPHRILNFKLTFLGFSNLSFGLVPSLPSNLPILLPDISFRISFQPKTRVYVLFFIDSDDNVKI